tara:strand:+ start:333 stop:584 length:252 start_codon:yes stop_codon:yes gene_type:complete
MNKPIRINGIFIELRLWTALSFAIKKSMAKMEKHIKVTVIPPISSTAQNVGIAIDRYKMAKASSPPGRDLPNTSLNDNKYFNA